MKPLKRKVVRRILAGLVVIGVGFLQPSTGFAEPGPVVRYLMNTPTSLMTFGLYQLNARLSAISSDVWAEVAISASYDWDKNRIMIFADDVKGNAIESKEKCSEIVSDIRVYGGINPKDATYLYGENSRFADEFSPMGTVSTSAPKDFKRKIDDIIKISVQNFSKNIKCGGDLVSTEVLFDE